MKTLTNLVIFFLVISTFFGCSSENQKERMEREKREQEQKNQQKEAENAKIEEQKKNAEAKLVEQYKSMNFDEPFDIWTLSVLNAGELEQRNRFEKICIEGSDEETKAKRWAKYSYYSAVSAKFYKWFDHHAALRYKRFYKVTSIPNLNVDTVVNFIDLDKTFRQTKLNYFDSIPFLDGSEEIKTGEMSKEIFEKRRLYHSAVVYSSRGSLDKFPIYFRNERIYNYLWKNNKKLLFDEVTSKYYKDINGDFYVKTLLQTYRIIKSKNPNFELFEQAIKEDKENIDYSSLKVGEFSKKFINQGELVEKGKRSDRITAWEDWFFSFWYRRYIEGTVDITYKILSEIDTRYK